MSPLLKKVNKIFLYNKIKYTDDNYTEVCRKNTLIMLGAFLNILHELECATYCYADQADRADFATEVLEDFNKKLNNLEKLNEQV